MIRTFDELWKDLEERSKRWAISIVQDYKELEYVFNLIKGCRCQSYLEIGSAEGNSLYVLSHAMVEDARKILVDFGEEHTAAPRKEVLDKIKLHISRQFLGNSHNTGMLSLAQQSNKMGNASYDVVFIDAGHTYEDVIADAISFGWLANRYIIFHNVCLAPIKKAIEWYLAQNPQFKYHEFINSTHYGYGIIEV